MTASFSDMFFGFLEEDNRSTYDSSESDHVHVDDHDYCDDIEASQDGEREEKENAFWENQHQILQGTLRRTSNLETGIRKGVKEAVKEMEVSVCGCGKAMNISGCRECRVREVSGRVAKLGYNSSVCKTKWRSSPDIPSGEHMFLDVVENLSARKGGGMVRIIIEVNFRAEFEVARASDEYKKLLQSLPEVFVGKVERLQSVIKVMCSAAKKCLRDKRMHVGPWRKQAYMHAKWLGPCHRAPSPGPNAFLYDDLKPRPISPKVNPPSMLTVDLLDSAVNLQFCSAVAVV